MDTPDSAKFCMHCGSRMSWPEADVFFATAEETIRKISQAIEEGNTRRILVHDPKGNKVLDIPVNAGLTAAIMAPWLTGVGIFAAISRRYKVTLIKKDQ